ncbi:hypothetical protein [uncultured Aliiroseovarius sp.]|uniref:hypothetical protein n=1 Tax=uncultured Aliiroseovarius sp. TaxID=1658783 RepID=UPI00259906E9|nr:hypothetical protein [uncultured Aliiroseovarius sp.]
MNLELHGCVDVNGANDLCDMGFISPVLITCTGIGGRTLSFQAVQRELTAHIETGNMLAALAVEHPFILEAKERMSIDQFRSLDVVVFDEGHLNNLSPAQLTDAYKRSAESWRP